MSTLAAMDRQIAGVFKSPRRPLFLFFLGCAAGIVEYESLFKPAMGRPMFSAEYSTLPHIIYAAIVAAGIAYEAEVPPARLRYSMLWAAVGAFGESLFSPTSAALGRVLFGAGIGTALTGPGPLHPVPWLAAARGALGACIGGVVAHILASHGAPGWILPGFEVLVLGIFLEQGRAARLLTHLSAEYERIRARGISELSAQAERIINLTVQSVEEIDASEERTGNDRSASRSEAVRVAREALGLLRRKACLAGSAEDVSLRIGEKVSRHEAALAALYRAELEGVLE